MLNTTKTELRSKLRVIPTGLAIALGALVANVYSLPLNAQTGTLKDTLFQNIEAGKDGWNFISEEETISIQNNLQEFGDYSISNSTFDSDIRLTEEDKRWGNHGE